MKNYDVKLWFSKSSQAVITVGANNIKEAKSAAYKKYAHKNIIELEIIREYSNKIIQKEMI
ncbi:MAG: hypothetical protein RBQ81_07125 [Arcobacteraceae bacterium]|jgi:hypothetical protein|nr:hypothetical protein [Arcobacteraceae bacterium]